MQNNYAQNTFTEDFFICIIHFVNKQFIEFKNIDIPEPAIDEECNNTLQQYVQLFYTCLNTRMTVC